MGCLPCPYVALDNATLNVNISLIEITKLSDKNGSEEQVLLHFSLRAHNE